MFASVKMLQQCVKVYLIIIIDVKQFIFQVTGKQFIYLGFF